MQSILPSKESIEQLPLFQNLDAQHIFILQTLEQCYSHQKELSQATLLGFDTESKPTFIKGETQTGPHLIQLATLERAYLFMVNEDTLQFLRPILMNHEQMKVGFGLKNDARLFQKYHIDLHNMLDLAKCFTSFGINTPVGLKNALALLFQVHFKKSKKISTSNWSNKNLSLQQIEYAAADAYAPVLIFEELNRLGRLPISISQTNSKLRSRK